MALFSNAAILAGGEDPSLPHEAGLSGVASDPLGQLPASPQEAHRRLEERSIKWPADLERNVASFQAASVQPGLRVSIPFDSVDGFATGAGAQVRVELIRGAVTVQTVDTTTNTSGWFHADLSAGDIRSGDRVRVSDLSGGGSLEVDCTLSGTVDMVQDKVNGTAPTANAVDVYIAAPSTYYGDIPPGVAHRKVTAAGGGFSADFSGPQTQQGDSRPFNILRGDVAYIFSTDAAGNSVMDVASTGGSLVVYPQYDEVMGFYLPHTTLTVWAGSASRTTVTSKDGFLDALFLNYDIVPGDRVSCDMGAPRSITVGDVSAACDPYTNEVSGAAPPNRLMRITMNAYVNPVVVETQSDANGNYKVNLTDTYTISGIERYNVTWYDDDGDAVVYEFQSYSWFLPEGYTGPGFDEWILVMNPTSTPAQVRVIFQTWKGPEEGPLFTAVPNSRNTIHVNEWTPNTHVSTMVTSMDGVTIMAERAMYMYKTIDGKWGAHDSIGILTPSSVWYLPEGATYPGFDEWVLIQNPNNVQVKVRVQFLGRGGIAKQIEVDIGAGSRYTVHANDHVPNTETSARVECLTMAGGEGPPRVGPAGRFFGGV
jgi:hypothetical protein